MNLSRSHSGYPIGTIGTMEYMVLLFMLVAVTFPPLDGSHSEDAHRAGRDEIPSLTNKAGIAGKGFRSSGFMGFGENIKIIPDSIGIAETPNSQIRRDDIIANVPLYPFRPILTEIYLMKKLAKQFNWMIGEKITTCESVIR